MRSIRWTDWAILALCALSLIIGTAGLTALQHTQERGIMDGER